MTACQDRNIRVYSVAGAKQTKTFKGSASEDGTLIKVVLDLCHLRRLLHQLPAAL